MLFYLLTFYVTVDLLSPSPTKGNQKLTTLYSLRSPKLVYDCVLQCNLISHFTLIYSTKCISTKPDYDLYFQVENDTQTFPKQNR